MKKSWYLGLSVLLTCLPLFAYADFSLESVQSIHCSDANPSASLNIFFTTDDAAAGAYVRQSGDIPYDYYNKMGQGDTQAGTFSLSNNPDAENGKIILIDNCNPASPSQLILEPTLSSGVYNGTLSGDVETQSGWGKLEPHEMKCTVVFFQS